MIVDKLFETNPFSASKEDSDLFIAELERLRASTIERIHFSDFYGKNLT